jgi:transcriptional regulator with XRE-family HTH domain
VAKEPKFHCDVRASFAMAFRNWRVKHNIPLKQIAKDLGLAVSTVSYWELGKYFPTGYNLELLVEYTGLPPCKLFCIMADKCVPPDCRLAMNKIKPPRQGPLAERPAGCGRLALRFQRFRKYLG